MTTGIKRFGIFLLLLIPAGYISLLVFGALLGSHEDPTVPPTAEESKLIQELGDECGCMVEFNHHAQYVDGGNRIVSPSTFAQISLRWIKRMNEDSLKYVYNAARDICISASDSFVTNHAARVATKMYAVLNYRELYDQIKVSYRTDYMSSSRYDRGTEGTLCDQWRTFNINPDGTLSLDKPTRIFPKVVLPGKRGVQGRI